MKRIRCQLALFLVKTGARLYPLNRKLIIACHVGNRWMELQLHRNTTRKWREI